LAADTFITFHGGTKMGDLERKRREQERQLSNKAMERAAEPSLPFGTGGAVDRRISMLCEHPGVEPDQTLVARSGPEGVEFFRGPVRVGILSLEEVRPVCPEPESAEFRVVSVKQGMADLQITVGDIRGVRPKLEGEEQ
jgi:hypothetical protein